VACYYRHLRRGDYKAGTPTKKWRHRLSSIDPVRKTAVCSTCGKVKITPRSGKGNWRCTVDANHRSKMYKSAYRQVKKDEMLDHCEICGSTKKLCWDHDHSVSPPTYRGTLCGRCNSAIGLLEERSDLLKKAHRYLRTH